MALQVIGCACIATGTLPLFYVGLALFLTGSGFNVTCINMMLTQRFTPRIRAAKELSSGTMPA
jgi:POT family proton-dependent oligopeptide transporter